MKTDEERKALVNEMKKLIEPGLKSIDDIKHVEERGAEILRALIDDDILRDCITLGKSKEKPVEVTEEMYDFLLKALSYGYHARADEDKGERSNGYGARFFEQFKITKKPPHDPNAFAIWQIKNSHRYSYGHIQHVKDEQIVFRGTFEESEKEFNAKYAKYRKYDFTNY